MRRYIYAFAALLAVTPLTSQELIQNGGFETGDFTGWTVFSDCFVVHDGTFVPNGLGFAQPPLAGNFDALTNSDLGGPNFCQLSQQVSFPGGVTGAVLSWTERIHNATPVFADLNGVTVRLEEVGTTFRYTVSETGPDFPRLASTRRRTVDLSSFLAARSGGPVRLAFVQEDFLGPMNLFIDDVSLIVSTEPTGVARFDEFGSACGGTAPARVYEGFGNILPFQVQLQFGFHVPN